jgi:hypothetical protein
MSMKNFNDNIGNRARGLLGRSTVPQPTAPTRAPTINMYEVKFLEMIDHMTMFTNKQILRLGKIYMDRLKHP